MKSHKYLSVKSRISTLVRGSALLIAAFSGYCGYADDLYWDSNGATPGAGTIPTGTWGTDSFWSTDPTGSIATTAYVPNSNVFFSAGTDATGAYTVTLSGSQSVSGMTFQSGKITLGGTGSPVLSIGAGGITLTSGINNTAFIGSTLSVLLTADQSWTNNSTQILSAGANGSIVGNAATGAVRTLTFTGSATTNSTISAIIGDGSGGGKVALVQNGSAGTILGGINTYSGGTTITSGTLGVALSNNATLGSGAVSIASGGTLSFTYNGAKTSSIPNAISGAGNVLVTGSSNFTDSVTLNNPLFTGNITLANATGATTLILANYDAQTIAGNVNRSAGTGGSTTLQKTGPGTLTLAGTNGASALSFITKINGGGLNLDYSTNNTSKLADNGTFTLGGGSVTLNGGSHVEIVSTTTMEIGSTVISRTGGGSSSLQLGGLSRVTGSTVNFAEGSLATTTASDTNGILGGSAWATVGTVGSADWASAGAGGPIVAYSAYTPWAADVKVPTSNYLLTGTSTNTVASAISTLKINTDALGQSLDIGTFDLTLGSSTSNSTVRGGILFTGAQNYTITGATGVLKGTNASGSDIILQQMGTGVLTVDAIIASGSSGGTLTKSGPGTVVLTKTNTYSGVTYIDQGTLSISSNGNLGTEATGSAVNINGATLQATGTFTLFDASTGLHNRAIAVGGGGATLDVAATKTLTVPGVISNLNTSTVGTLTKSGTGTLELGGVNTYSGRTLITGGKLSLLSTGTINSSTTISISNGAIFDVSARPTSYSLSGISLTVGTDGVTGGFLNAGAIQLTLGGNLSINFTALPVSNGSVDLFDFGTKSGNFDNVLIAGSINTALIRSSDLWTGTSGNYSFSLDQTTGILLVTVPEPSVYAVAISGMLAIVIGARSRRRVES